MANIYQKEWQKITRARDLGRYKSSEGLPEKLAISLGFWFYKICLKCWNLKLRTKKIWSSVFFALVFHCNISSWISLSKHDIYKSINDYSCKKIYRRKWNAISVENMSRRNQNHGTLAIFFVTFWRFQHFRRLLQNPTPKLAASFFSP